MTIIKNIIIIIIIIIKKKQEKISAVCFGGVMMAVPCNHISHISEECYWLRARNLFRYHLQYLISPTLRTFVASKVNTSY